MTASIDVADGPHRRRRLTASERRSELLRAATEVFVNQGFQQVAIDEVAQAAGVSKALIYEHFSSKNELQETVIRHIVEELFASVAEAVASVPDTTASTERLRAGVTAYFRFVEERPTTWHRLFREGVGREASQAMLATEPGFVSGIAAVIGQSPEAAPLATSVEGKLRIRVAAQMMSGSLHWLGNWWVDHMDLVDLETIVDWAIDSVWLGLEGTSRKLSS